MIAGDQKVEAQGLLDTGSTINVLPYTIGKSIGLEWDDYKTQVPLLGNLAAIEAVGVVIFGQVDTFKPCKLVFAWAKTDHIPLILGQTNFFQEFNVCFFRSELIFEVREKM